MLYPLSYEGGATEVARRIYRLPERFARPRTGSPVDQACQRACTGPDGPKVSVIARAGVTRTRV